MSEENKDIIEVEEIGKEEAETANPNRHRKPMYIALSVIGVVVLGAVLILVFRGRQGGDVVPAPRSV